MKWTKETPTEPGWYWLREYGIGPIKMGDVHEFLDVLLCEETGSDLTYRLSDYPNSTIWYGPIEPPAVD